MKQQPINWRAIYSDPITMMFIISLIISVFAGAFGYWSFCWLMSCGTLVVGTLLLEAKKEED